MNRRHVQWQPEFGMRFLSDDRVAHGPFAVNVAQFLLMAGTTRRLPWWAWRTVSSSGGGHQLGWSWTGYLLSHPQWSAIMALGVRTVDLEHRNPRRFPLVCQG